MKTTVTYLNEINTFIGVVVEKVSRNYTLPEHKKPLSRPATCHKKWHRMDILSSFHIVILTAQEGLFPCSVYWDKTLDAKSNNLIWLPPSRKFLFLTKNKLSTCFCTFEQNGKPVTCLVLLESWLQNLHFDLIAEGPQWLLSLMVPGSLFILRLIFVVNIIPMRIINNNNKNQVCLNSFLSPWWCRWIV